MVKAPIFQGAIKLRNVLDCQAKISDQSPIARREMPRLRFAKFVPTPGVPVTRWPQNQAKGTPNILLTMTDEVDCGAPSTFGGVIPTLKPGSDRERGLRYIQFHSTALCSPTRGL